MTENRNVNYSIEIWTLVVVGLLILLVSPVSASKHVELDINSGELVYCMYGNPHKTTVFCDKVDRNNDLTFADIDFIIEKIVAK